MAISCGCDYDTGILSVGDMREVKCRTPRKCYACAKPINANDAMYMQSMFDWDEVKAASPIFLCEECGDMACNLIEYEYCFSFGESIRGQWLDYLHDTDPNNPALKYEKERKGAQPCPTKTR